MPRPKAPGNDGAPPLGPPPPLRGPLLALPLRLSPLPLLRLLLLRTPRAPPGLAEGALPWEEAPSSYFFRVATLRPKASFFTTAGRGEAEREGEDSPEPRGAALLLLLLLPTSSPPLAPPLGLGDRSPGAL